MARINGNHIEILEGTTLLQYVNNKEYDLNYIAVECNGTIIPKSQYDEKVINVNDVIEIVNFVGGGWYENHIKRKKLCYEMQFSE